MANPNRKKRTKEEWDKLTEQAAKNAAKRMQEKNPSKQITAAQAREAAQDPTSAGAKAIREKVLADMKAQKQAARRKEYAAQQAAARAKEAFSLPLPSATAAKKQETKTAADFNAPLAQMSRNSTSWSMLREGKDAAKKAKWPEKAVDKMTAKQDALHRKNAEIAKPYDIQYDAASGAWKGGDSYGADAGKPVYIAQKALPLPGSTASDMVAGARKVQEMAALPLPNHAAMTAEQKKIYNLVRGARMAEELSGGVEKFAGLFPGRLGSGVESVGKNLVGGALGFGETLDQMIANEKTNFHNEELRKLTRELAEANRSLNVRGLPASIRQEKIARIRELQERIEEISAKDSVDMTLPGQVLQAEAAEAAEKTLDGMTGLPRKATEAAMGIGQMVPVIAATAAGGPVAGGIVAAGQAAAGKMYELNARGLPAGESFGRGLVSGGIEALTEKFSLGNLNAIAKSGGSGWIKNMLKQAGIEASEEGASYLMNYIADAAAKDPEAQLSMAELLDQASTGALSGGFMAAAGTGVNRLANIGRKPAKGLPLPQTQEVSLPKTETGKTAYSLPLPDVRDAALPETGKQGLPLLTSFPEQAKTQTVGLPTSFPEQAKPQTAQGLPLPTSFPETGKTAYSLPLPDARDAALPETGKQTQGLPLPEMQQKAASIDANPETHTPEQMAQDEFYRKQIDGAFDGSLPSGRKITLGETPEIIQQYGANAREMTMTQTVARKIAYPTGYLGLKHGHNLGMSALKNLPQQLRDPVAILKNPQPNASGADSVIILTEWNDKNGNPIVVPIQLDVTGALDVPENVIASTFGAEYIDRLLGVNDGNVMYTKNGENIRQLLSNGRPMPEAMADDIFAKFSMPQAGAEVKGQAQEIPDPGILRQKEMEQLAQDQLDALESDSFDVPDAEMRERTAQMAENKTLDDYTLEELDALVSESYVNQNADLRDRDQLEKRFGEKWEGDIRDIREMIEQADEQGAGTVIPPEIAVRLNKVRGAYNKTLGRVLDQAAGKDTRMREFLREKVEMPLASAKGDYAHGVKSMLDSYAENMQKYGIRMGSREDAAVMWYGEGQRVDEAGDTVPYTEADLKRDFPKNWQKIKAADAVNRRIYDDYIDRINEARAIVYPHAEERVKLEIAKLRARSAAYQTQIEALDARITKGMATPEEAASRDFLMQEMQSADQMANKKQADLDSGEALRGKRMPKRKDYYHHFQEMAEGFGALRNIMETDADIDPRLVGTSDHTRPNTKWQGAMQERITNRTVQSSIGAMLDYVPAAEFMIHIDPQIARLRGIVRDLVDGTADANQTNANGLIEWLTDYTNDIAGKTNPFDRALQKVFGRKSMKVVEWLNGRAKSNAILGNLNSAIAQWFNLPNGVAIIKNPIDLSKGMADYAMALKDGTEARKKLDQSNFMTERYLDESVDQFDKNLLHKPKQFATWLLTVGDKQASQVIWFSAYEQGVRKGVADPVFYADDITQRAVGGRGIGEVPLTQQSKVTKLLAPFQVEVNNQWQLLKQMVGNKDALGLTLMFLLTFGLNELKEGLTGTRTGMDLIDAGKDAWEELSGDEDASAWDYVQTIGGRLTGEVASNVPYGAQIAGLFISDENQRQKLFGESDPTRFGTGNIGIDALFEPVTKFANGETIDPTELITNFMLPWGGKQISRVKGALEDQGIVPKIRLGRKIAKNGEGQPAHIGMLQYGKQPVPGAYNEEGTKLKFALPTDFGTIAKSAAFGRYSTDAGKTYIEGGNKMLNEGQTTLYERLAQGGTDPQKAYEAIRAVTGTKAPEDGSLTGAQAKREAIMALDLTPEEKVELNRALVGGDDLVSFQDRDSFNITNTVAARNQPAAFALMREQGMDAAQAKKYAELVDDQGATYTLGKDQKITKTYEDGRQEERLLYTKDGKAARLKKAYETIQADESLTDGQKNGVVRAVVLSKLGKKYAGEYAEEFIGGIGVEQLIDAQAAYDKIYDAVQKDTTIHENNRDEYVRVRFADYLENTGLDFLRRESLWYFQSHDESEFKEPWSEIIRKTTPSDEEERARKQSALRGLQDSGMDESLFKVIKAGMGRVYADKDANGESIDGSAKKKKIAYLNKWEGLTAEQKNLIMKACGYKYGMGEKPKKGKSSSSKFPYALPTSFKLPSMKSLLPF